MKYDSIIIGAGLSGIAAGIRLSHFDKKVVILEAHTRAGGMNSYYSRQGRLIDVGLHAMTNYAPAGKRNVPLTKLLRQLRLRHEDLELVEQDYSEISFPSAKIRFSNDINTLRSDISRIFPAELSGFDRLRQDILEFNATSIDDSNLFISSKLKLEEYFRDKELINMLLCPVMFYGNAMEDDMNWVDFAVLWSSIFEDGLCRPRNGMKDIIDLLLQRYQDNGGEIQFRKKVEKISKHPKGELEVTLDDGTKLRTTQIYSSARLVETSALWGEDLSAKLGKISYAELVLYLDKEPEKLGCKQSITFFSRNDDFSYRMNGETADLTSGVICFPDNFKDMPHQHEGTIRFSFKASYKAWNKLSPEEYKAEKKRLTAEIISYLESYLPGLSQHITFSDMFTPLTLSRYTGHRQGSIYGSPQKTRDAVLSLPGVYLIGTDQGFLGITGSLLSGISIVNRYGLQ